MEESPVARGLFLCERVIIEEGTRNVSLINCFTRRLVPTFPTPPQQLAVYSALTNGRGTIRMALRVAAMSDDVVAYERSIPIAFPDPLVETRFLFRIHSLVFPHPGSYEFSLLVAETPVAVTRCEVLPVGDQA